ncbi:hypothetical protein ACQKDS_15580 [Serratia sp. NPDC078593]|uniref:hypothetical protein n=1 Tax=unclassified Serratia (in: enterobacteria) TaxID=2647522 RepID=UPI0037D5D761
MKVIKRISFGVILLSLVSLAGCMLITRSNFYDIPYESTLNSKNIGYIDYQSSDLLNQHIPFINANIIYTGNKGPYDRKQVSISNLQPKDDSVRIYVPYVKGAKFEQVDLNFDYGTVRLFSTPLDTDSASHKRLVKGIPTELTDNGKKITITSEITASEPYSASMLRRIKK